MRLWVQYVCRHAIVFLAMIIWFGIFSNGLANTSAQQKPLRNYRIDADNVRTDFKTDTLYANGNITVTDGDTVIKGQSAVVKKRSQKIALTGNVHLSQDGMVIKSHSLAADKSTGQITAKQHVEFTLDDIQGKAEVATYYQQKNIVVLTGNPVAWKNDNKIEGKEMVIDMINKTIKSSGKTKIIISENELSR